MNKPGVIEQYLDKTQVRAAFERAADTYDASAVLQREIADRLLERLDLIKRRPALILDIGCGTGYCTKALQRRYRLARVLGIDIAEAMAQRARRKAGWLSRSRFVCGDAEILPLADASADMIFSNLTLQWCNPNTVFQEFARLLRPGGVLMFTSFGPDTLHELRSAWRAVDDRPHVHGFIDMHHLGDALVQAGFADPVMDREEMVLTYADVMEVLRDLKNIGAHNVASGRHRGLTGKNLFKRFQAAYRAMAQDGRIQASYEVVYGHAWAPENARHGRAGPAVVPVSHIGRRGR